MRRAVLFFLAASITGCPDGEIPPIDGGPSDAPPYDGPPVVSMPCSTPGSIQYIGGGSVVVVPGGPANVPDLSYLKVPAGFCVHWYGNVGNARQIRFAPGGELFVASPTTSTTGGGANGQASIIILPDDNLDGFADSPITFLSNLPSTQGLLFTADEFYYQDATRILKIPYKPGDRAPQLAGVPVVDIQFYSSAIHWPKTLAQADDGKIYVTNGGDQGELCEPAHPFHGGILEIDGSPEGLKVAKGLRNPIGIRCSRGHNRCFSVELAKDYSAAQGGREKLVPIRLGDDWGFPCCATKDLPYAGQLPVPDCSNVVAEDASFVIGNTPFDLDFETGKWPEPWRGRVYVPLHGEAGTWKGARVVAIAIDPNTGMPLPSSNLDGGVSGGGMSDFAIGWDDSSFEHGRPAAVAFSPDGRLFLTNDNDGNIVWIAPLDL